MAKEVYLAISIEKVLDSIEIELARIIDNLLESVILEIGRLRDMGMADQAIKGKLLLDSENLTGVFGGIKTATSNLARQSTNILNQSSYLDRLVELNNETNIYEWVLDAGADHCGTCPPKAGKRQDLDKWIEDGLPASGVDECGKNCRCSLVPVSIIKHLEA